MKRMLELGCGDNPRCQPEYGEYYGCDTSTKSLVDAAQKVDGLLCGTQPILSAGYSKGFFECKIGYQPLPFDDNYFDFILGDQFLEHIPRIGHKLFTSSHNDMMDSVSISVDFKLEQFNPVIECLNECWRVAKSDANLQFNVPKWNSKEMQQDPTHVNACPKEMWLYWKPEDQWNLKESYHINGSFILSDVIDAGWYEVHKLKCVK